MHENWATNIQTAHPPHHLMCTVACIICCAPTPVLFARSLVTCCALSPSFFLITVTCHLMCTVTFLFFNTVTYHLMCTFLFFITFLFLITVTFLFCALSPSFLCLHCSALSPSFFFVHHCPYYSPCPSAVHGQLSFIVRHCLYFLLGTSTFICFVHKSVVHKRSIFNV